MVLRVEGRFRGLGGLELKIIELRERAKKKLGSKFDIKEFHDEVLKDGCLPLIILETKINRWIESKAAKN